MFFSLFSYRIIYFDICAIIIYSILLISILSKKMVKGFSNLSFILILIVSLLTAIIDLWCSLYTSVLPRTESNLSFRYVLHCLYFIFRNLTIFAYVSYIISVSSSWIIFNESKLQSIILVLPYIFVFLSVSTNCFSEYFFYFDNDMQYQRSEGIMYLYFVAGFYMVYAIYYLLRYRRLFSKNQFLALFSMVPINLTAVVLQLLFPGILVEMFATSVGCLIIAITIQSPESLIDQDTGFFNQETYLIETRRNFILNRKMNIVFVGIQNFKDLQIILNYNSFSSMLKQITSEFESIKREMKYFGDMFSLKNGLFAFISYEKDLTRTKEIAQRVHDFMMKTIKIQQLELKIIPRVCYFQTPNDIDTYDSLISFGKFHQVLLPDTETFVDISELNFKKELYLRNDLNDIVADAIVNRKFEMYYQPIYSVKEKRFVSAEALIRLKNEKYGFISPDLFIAAAEKNGTILQIGDLIFDDVCRFIGSDEFKQLNLDFIEINLSVAQCLEADLAEKVKGYLTKYNVSPSMLNLEITERESIRDLSVFDNNMQKLVDMGIDFSLDDYGTGYSNIRRIANLPLKVVKIDKSFVDEISSPVMQAIVESTVHMLQELDKEIVVEGVEEVETARKFVDLKCDYLQGYYFSRPLPVPDFINAVKGFDAEKYGL